MKNWLPLLFGILASAPWWIRALVPIRFQEKYDRYLNPSGMKSLAIICVSVTFIWANYQAMKDQNKDFIKLQKQNIELTTKINTFAKPHLVGQILARIIGSGEDGSTMVMLLVSITNTGSPSIVDGWHLSVNNKIINLNGIMPIVIPTNVHFFKDKAGGEPLINFYDPSDAINNKAMTPIKQGDMIRGWLMFILKDTKQSDITTNTNLTVSFHDYIGNIYSTNMIVGEKANEGPFYYQGIKNPFDKKTK